jgi:predicted component of type VI protein secretion system
MSDIEPTDATELSSLTQLRDEIRVRLHLAQLDAKDKWQELETQLVSLEHRVAADGGSILGATTQLAKDLKQSLVDFRQRLSA